MHITLPLSGRQEARSGEAESRGRLVHSKGLFEVSPPTGSDCGLELNKQQFSNLSHFFFVAPCFTEALMQSPKAKKTFEIV
jgi:hypothetical protein